MTTRRFLTVATSCLALIGVVGCDYQRSSTTAPSAVATSSPEGGTGTLVGRWTSVTAADAPPPTLTDCQNIVWSVTTQTAFSVTGQVSATCMGSVPFVGTGTGQLSGQNVQVTIVAVGTKDNQPCNVSLTGTGTADGDYLRIPYTGTTCVGPVSGTATLKKNPLAPAPTPPAPPVPPPTPPGPTPGPVATDAIDMSQAVILNSPFDMASWPITTKLTTVAISPTGIAVEFSKKDGPGRWPDITPPGWDGPLQYTLGMCLTINGRWHCSAVVEFWYGLDESGGPPWEYAKNWFYDSIRWAPMTGHQPAVGETIGFFVCAGDCRNNKTGDLSPVKERTNVVLVPMPGNGGAIYRF